MAHEVFLRLAREAGSVNGEQGANLKAFYLSLGYSEYGIRMHLRRLERDGWIQLVEGDGDRRGRRVVLTDKFRTVLERYLLLWEEPVQRLDGRPFDGGEPPLGDRRPFHGPKAADSGRIR